MNDPICEHCHKLITPSQRRSGYFSPGRAWFFTKGWYEHGTLHSHCNTFNHLIQQFGTTAIPYAL